MGLFSIQTQTIVIFFVILIDILLSSGHIIINFQSTVKTCTTNADCSNADFCLGGQCICHFFAQWDPTVSKCRIPADFFCDQDLDSCVENSECIKSERNNHGMCTCKAGFSKLSNHLCEADNNNRDFNPSTYIRSSTTNTAKITVELDQDADNYDYSAERERLISTADEIVGHYKKPCTADYQCENREMLLECINQICSCQEEDIYEENLKKCVATPRLPCFTPKNPCVSNATCQIVPTLAEWNMGYCVCDSGFEISSDEKKCIQRENLNQNQTQKNLVMNTLPENSFGFYGKNCSSNEDCENPNILFCQENKCSCPSNSSFWDQNGKICRSTVGHFCSDENPCVENTVCYNSICLCDNGYHRNHEGYCISIENSIHEHNTGKFSPNYLGYLGWILAAIFFILFFISTAYLGFRKWKNSRPSWPISYKNHRNEGTTNIEIQ